MKIFPAIDLRGGQVVRLTQGDYGQMKVYGEDPLATARGFARAGAENLHVVDLDGAKEGVPQNLKTIREITAGTRLFVQAGGGIRTFDRMEQWLDAGVSRVILGTAALRDEAFLREALALYGGQIAVGVDVRGGKVAVGGWTETSDVDGMAFCRTLRDMGVGTVIYTDISRDGKLSGTNLDAYRQLSDLSGLRVIASGGITQASEIEALRSMGIHGAIVGKALYEGRIDLADALRAAGEDRV